MIFAQEPLFVQISFPRCAICNKHVDELTTTTNPIDGTITIVATCHGARDEVTIPMTKYVDANNVSFDGVAFATKALPKGQP